MGCGIKQTKLYRSFLKHTMQVQTVITALMIMIVTSVITSIPDITYFLQCFGFLTVQFLQKFFFYLLAVFMLPSYIYLQSFVYQIFFAVHNVCDVP